MTIKLYLGNVGSGKTACAVREIMNNPDMHFLSNIKTIKVKNNTPLKSEMIFKKELLKTTKDGEQIYKLSFNKEFWVNYNKKVSVIIDEAHNCLNPRRSQSKVNQIMGDFIAMLRRVLGQTDTTDGDLILITQLDRRIDVIAREMATMVKYHRCHYIKNCTKCGLRWAETNDFTDPAKDCMRCKNKNIKKTNFKIEVFCFPNIQEYVKFDELKIPTYYRRYFINDIEKYFKHYNTLQWDDLLSDIYD